MRVDDAGSSKYALRMSKMRPVGMQRRSTGSRIGVLQNTNPSSGDVAAFGALANRLHAKRDVFSNLNKAYAARKAPAGTVGGAFRNIGEQVKSAIMSTPPTGSIQAIHQDVQKKRMPVPLPVGRR